MPELAESAFWFSAPVDKVAYAVYLSVCGCALWTLLATTLTRGKKRGWLLMGGALPLLLGGISAFYHNLMYVITVMFTAHSDAMAKHYMEKAVSNLMFPLFLSFLLGFPLLLFAVWQIRRSGSISGESLHPNGIAHQ